MCSLTGGNGISERMAAAVGCRGQCKFVQSGADLHFRAITCYASYQGVHQKKNPPAQPTPMFRLTCLSVWVCL